MKIALIAVALLPVVAVVAYALTVQAAHEGRR